MRRRIVRSVLNLGDVLFVDDFADRGGYPRDYSHDFEQDTRFCIAHHVSAMPGLPCEIDLGGRWERRTGPQ